jgi:hypothetical protein
VDKKLMTLILAMAVLLMVMTDAWARMNETTNTSAEVELDLHLNIPTLLSLQIGSSGAVVDTVTFQITGPSSRTPVVKSNVYPPFGMSSNTTRGIVLVADSSGGLKSGDKIIPVSNICWKGTGDLSGSEGCFDGSPTQRIKSFSGKGNWRGGFVFEYRSSQIYPPGNYTGTISYTLMAQ